MWGRPGRSCVRWLAPTLTIPISRSFIDQTHQCMEGPLSIKKLLTPIGRWIKKRQENTTVLSGRHGDRCPLAPVLSFLDQF
ncbi:hypothetical protein BJV74DRAFT_851155 [Russula compacta]|nr:hypothetical protein BJV74DRAFT_851155 [Russula compacta]